MSPTVYPLSAVRALALYAQRLHNLKPPKPTPDAIHDLTEDIGFIQIDTLQRVTRSQYINVWSRLGTYDPDDLDALVYGDPQAKTNARRLFEYWKHAACLIPLRDYRYTLPSKRWYIENAGKRNQRMLDRPEYAQAVPQVLKRIKREGGLRAADFDDPRAERGSWWDWKPAKWALEYHFDTGQLMIANRVKFQRVYDLPERVLPDWVDTSEPTADEALRHRLELGLKAFGICRADQIGDYTHMRKRDSRPHVKAMREQGILVEVQAELLDGDTHALAVHRDNVPLLEEAASGELKAERTTFLSPFDGLFYAHGRDEEVWGFRQVLEAYKPKDQRIWGYFCLPILHRDRLVGRLDPRLDRKANRLHLEHLHLEPGIKPEDEIVAAVAGAMRDFMAFHSATELVIEHSDPATFGQKLSKAVEAGG